MGPFYSPCLRGFMFYLGVEQNLIYNSVDLVQNWVIPSQQIDITCCFYW